MYFDPASLLTFIQEDLTPFVRSEKGQLSIAADPYHFLELLGEAPASWRAVLHWAGDENATADLPAAFLSNELHVGITCNLGLTVKPSEQIAKKRAGGAPALLTLVALTRARLRSLVLPDNVSEGALTYLGAKPVVLPDGLPLAAYRLRFSITTADEPITPRH